MTLYGLIKMHVTNTVDLLVPQHRNKNQGLLEKLSNLGRVKVKGKLLYRKSGMTAVRTDLNYLEITARSIARYGR